MDNKDYHIPVLLEESIRLLEIKQSGVYVDATFGGGGHSGLILDELGAEGRLFGFDQDEDAESNQVRDERLTFVKSNFRFIKRFLKLYGVEKVDGILADLGVSSHQFDIPERGFSYRFDAAPLDMRMNIHQEKTAADILNTYKVEDLQKVFSAYGEVRNARTLALRIAEVRELVPFTSVASFLSVVESISRGSRFRYLSQVFQALRIEVNDEMGALKELLMQATDLLSVGGRLVIISYHSIEDRLVKNYFKSGNFEGVHEKDYYGNILRPLEPVTRKALQPEENEIQENIRARSARLRAAKKL